MTRSPQSSATPRVLAHAPEELLGLRLQRLGEGIGKVVYASAHWVVKRRRDPEEILALIIIWKAVRRLQRLFPHHLRGLLDHPAPQLRILKALVYAFMLVAPRWLWYWTHAVPVLRLYTRRDRHGERLARTHLAGTGLIAETITFPPVRVRIGGWPGYLIVSEANERVESTVYAHLEREAAAGDWDEVEYWLLRMATGRGKAWRRGVFSMDAHLKNYGIIGDRLVLIDAGGLTCDWEEIEAQLADQETDEPPHVRLGLATILAPRPDLAARFDDAWRASVNPAAVRRQWPAA